jgi:8-oxo-dGTP pyrophosphatase MutT (NUDIX family)
MTHYVLGFAFTLDRQKVVLIRKNRGPVELHGLLNGVGGKIEPHETSYDAMHREFREETGVQTLDWRFRGRFSGPSYSVKVFSTFSDEVLKARTVEDEEVEIVDLTQGVSEPCPNVPLLVGLCLNPRVKRFSFEEE